MIRPGGSPHCRPGIGTPITPFWRMNDSIIRVCITLLDVMLLDVDPAIGR
jgi:hypothetical protein